MSSIKIVYDLSPPTEVKSDVLSPSKSHNFPVQASPEDDQKTYYTALHTSIANAKELVGNELTAWRDAVGKSELTKEPKQTKSEEDEDEEEEEEQE